MTNEKEDKNKDKKERFLKYFRDLPVQKLAAASIGVHEDTIVLWKKNDSDFSDQVDNAKAQWAMEKCKGVRSKEWLLERIMKDHFAERKEQTGANGAPLTVGVVSYADTKPKT